MQTIQDYVKERKANGAPLHAIWRELLEMGGDDKRMTEAMKAAEHIESVLVARNQKGMDYEKSGDEKRAITQYEANVEDWFDGSHPYERLRIIYARMGKDADVARVCSIYLTHGNPDGALKAKYQKILGLTK